MKKIIFNHKSYLLYDDIIKFKNEYKKLLTNKYEYILFPQLIYISLFKDSSNLIGAQNFYSSKPGSFSGEVNLESLKSLNVKYTMLGQYERKKLLGESRSEVKEKLYKSLDNKFNTLLCVGEVKKTSRPFFSIKKELNYYLKNIDKNKLKYLSIIYEPNYSIGSANINDIEYITTNIRKIKCYIKNKFNVNIEVYYAGLINNSNIKEIINICDGIVLGKKSCDISFMSELFNEL